ncbi:ATP-binding protein, partial [Kocuria palustris]
MLSTVETAFPPAPAPVAAQSPDRAEAPGLLLVGLSGGPDSLALSAAAAHWARRGRLRVGAAVIDHGMQEGSALVAERAAEQARELGLDPVEIRAVEVRERGEGPEAAARAARYTALHEIAAAHGARAILLGHTLDDQAESVLLGL